MMNVQPSREAAAAPYSPTIGTIDGARILGHLPEMRRDRIGMQHRIARTCDIARLRMGFIPLTMVSSPELAHEVLVAHADAFVKSQGLSIFARPLLGDGLLTSEHGVHKKRRRMMAPVFVKARIAAYAEVMAERAYASAQRMRAQRSIEIAREVTQATLEIVGKTLFDAEVGFEASDVGTALTEAMRQMTSSLTSIVPLPPQVPTPGNLRSRRAIARLDKTIYRLIADRRATSETRGDLLSLLLAARDEDGSAMEDVHVRDEAMTIFVAGHETTANAVAWALYLLSKNPDVRAALEAEVDTVLGKRIPTMADLASLPVSLRILKETMRLYPPAYIVGRRAERDVAITGLAVKKNDIVLVNIAGIHRRADIYDDPETFAPDRFTPEREKELPRLGYMPFGAGPRVCIGNHFALMEGQLMLATYAQHVRLDLEDGGDAAVEPLITLRPKNALNARVTAR